MPAKGQQVSQVFTAFDHGSNRDVDDTAEVLTSTATNFVNGILIRADQANTGIVYVGNSDVTAGSAAATDGYPLWPGDSMTIEIRDASTIYVIGSAANQIVYFIGV